MHLTYEKIAEELDLCISILEFKSLYNYLHHHIPPHLCISILEFKCTYIL